MNNAKSVAILAVALLLPAGAWAQTVKQLDQIDLGKPAAQAPKSDMERCLVDPASCSNKEFGGAKKFSLDDVVNLGIVDREEVKVAPAGTGGSATASVEPLPSIDIEVLFDYDSDALRPDQFKRLAELASLLKEEKFSSYKFAFLGHSDAKGAAGYNADLSRRRAEAVAAFVNQISGVPGTRFVARGLGASQLKTPDDPFGQANRRVQLVLVPVN